MRTHLVAGAVLLLLAGGALWRRAAAPAAAPDADEITGAAAEEGAPQDDRRRLSGLKQRRDALRLERSRLERDRDKLAAAMTRDGTLAPEPMRREPAYRSRALELRRLAEALETLQRQEERFAAAAEAMERRLRQAESRGRIQRAMAAADGDKAAQTLFEAEEEVRIRFRDQPELLVELDRWVEEELNRATGKGKAP